jgi:hypothetical protein
MNQERGILCFKSALGLEKRGNQVKDEEYQREYGKRASNRKMLFTLREHWWWRHRYLKRSMVPCSKRAGRSGTLL